jgi:hypothetical protein
MSAETVTVGDANKAATAALDIDKIIEKLLEVRRHAAHDARAFLRSSAHMHAASLLVCRSLSPLLRNAPSCICCHYSPLRPPICARAIPFLARRAVTFRSRSFVVRFAASVPARR